MARQPLPIGAHGNIKTKQISEPGEKPVIWQAQCRYRDADGQTRQVKRTGRSSAAATNELKKALADRRGSDAETITGSTRVSKVGERWLEKFTQRVATGERSPSSLRDYESAWRLHVQPGLGRLQVREATTARCETWLETLRRNNGAAISSRSRTVLSGVLGYAARMGAIPTNPVRDLSPIPGAGQRNRKPRAMTAAERSAWLEWMDTHAAKPPQKPGSPRKPLPRSPEWEARVIASRALGDVTRFMLGTGCRLGEVMAVSWDEVNLDAGTVRICWHIVRVKGEGLRRMPGAKSDAGDRLLRLPKWCVNMLMRRWVDEASGYPVFPDELGGWRDPNQVSKWLRWSRDEAGFGWVTSHVFRQTVITVLDEAGLKSREVADQAGHAKVTQTLDYMQRGIASEQAAVILDGMLD